jgi:hypothetical protein
MMSADSDAQPGVPPRAFLGEAALKKKALEEPPADDAEEESPSFMNKIVSLTIGLLAGFFVYLLVTKGADYVKSWWSGAIDPASLPPAIADVPMPVLQQAKKIAEGYSAHSF